ncbi:hypothetical protein ACFWA9_21685 [Kitasatospora sp. NPDC059973]|uniref:hypothetical protein n=1 Tax=Kitasatospora sp. NPDC059973 TaxID=3347020 RepID=UPI00368EA465
MIRRVVRRQHRWDEPFPPVRHHRTGHRRRGPHLLLADRHADGGLGALLLSSADPPATAHPGEVLLAADSTDWWLAG